MALDLTEAQAQLDLWLAASRAVATGKSYTIDGRQLTRENGSEIREQINYWSGMVADFTRQSKGEQRMSISLASWNT